MKNWLNDAIVYEIYPQSFYDTNGDGIGDLQGIIQKLDYIQECGFTAIWLNPVNKSPFRDGGYDITDFYAIDPRYGTNDDYRELCEKAHARNMKIIFDLVPGHTSIDHPWFTESAKAAKNEFTDRYIWSDLTFDSTYGISGYGERDGNYFHNFFWSQPALNYGFAHADPKKSWQFPTTHPACVATKNELKNIIKFWMDMGVDAFRVDMAQSLIKEDTDGSCMKAFWTEMKQYVKDINPECLLISEWGMPTDAIAAGFDCDFLLHFGNKAYTTLFRCESGRNTSHLVVGHSYFSKEGKGNINDYLDRYLYDYENINGTGVIGMITGNHDMPRLAHKRDAEDIKAAMTFLFTMPGVPFVYYGDEIGMDYIEGLPSKEGGYVRTGSRTPMQWNDEKNHGFSESNSPYLPVDNREGAPTVEAQLNDENSILSHVKKLISIRKKYDMLSPEGGLEILKAGYPFVFSRGDGSKKLYIAINPSMDNYEYCLPEKCKVILSQNAAVNGENITLNAVSFVIALTE